MINVQGAPAIYQSGAGALDRLPGSLAKEGFQKLFIIHGSKSLQAISKYLPSLAEFSVMYECYQGECTEKEVARLKEKALHYQADVVFGIGGGKVMDLVKAVGYQTKKEIVLLPTLSATCAAWTPLSVFYTEEGSFTHYTVYPKSSYMVLVEPRVLNDSPISYFRAGIGDTLAKWYEAKALIHSLETIPAAVQIGLQSAELCKNILLEESVDALHDLESKEISSKVLKVIDAVIMLGGMVGGFADHYGRIAGAHSVHNALTQIPSTHHLLHGEKVAYGLLVQLALEQKIDEVKKLLAFYEKIGLPKNLSDLGLSVLNQEELKIIAETSLLPSESIHLMKGNFKAADVLEAIHTVEKIHHYEAERVK